MPSAGWSNIFLQMMAGDPLPLPVIGEGQLELPWLTQIELVEKVKQDPYQVAQILQNWLTHKE